jgi:hypothetical protein
MFPYYHYALIIISTHIGCDWEARYRARTVPPEWDYNLREIVTNFSIFSLCVICICAYNSDIISVRLR